MPVNVDDHLIGPRVTNAAGLDWTKLPATVGSMEPNNTGFTQSGGTAGLTLQVGSQYLDNYALLATGWADAWPLVGDTAGGRAILRSTYSGIDRANPLAHPRYPFMYCTGVESIQGREYQRMTDCTKWQGSYLPTVNNGYQVDCFPAFPEYSMYDMKLGFAARMYRLLPNTTIKSLAKSVSYYPPNSSTKVTFSNVWPEWERNTVVRVSPKFETLVAQQGEYEYWSSTIQLNKPVTHQGQIKTPWPSTVVKVTWYNVPYAFANGEGVYQSNGVVGNRTVFSYATCTVNHNAFLGYNPGTLLFEGADVSEPGVRPFPTPIEFPAGSGKYIYRNIFTCDITLNFLHRDPKSVEDYAGNGYKPGGTNNTGNNIWAGHNLLPMGSSGDYYAAQFIPNKNNGLTAKLAVFPSFPHELLFCDPSWVVPFLP